MDLEKLQTEMNAFYSKDSNRRPVTKEDLDQDKFFVAYHSDKMWYRVRVNSMLDEFTAAVRFVDYGDFSMISIDNLQILWSQFRNLPMQAINAKLAGKLTKTAIRPVSWFREWNFKKLKCFFSRRYNSDERRLDS